MRARLKRSLSTLRKRWEYLAASTRLQNSSMPPIKIPGSFPRRPRGSAKPSTSALELLRERCPHECDGLLARPLGGTGEIADVAARAIDQDRGRQSDRAADALQLLKHV